MDYLGVLGPAEGSQRAPEDPPRGSQRGPRGAPQRPLQRARLGTPIGAKMYGFPCVLQQKRKPVIARTGSALDE